MRSIHAGRTIVLLLSLLFLQFTNGENSFIQDLIKKAETYNQYFPSQRVVLQTDRRVYQPGQQLWYKGLILEASSLQLTSFNEKMYVNLADASGKIVYRDICVTSNGEVNGCFTIPKKLQDGMFYLIAYSGWMKNEKPDIVFIQKIYIDHSVNVPENVKVSPSADAFKAGSTASFTLSNISGNDKLKYVLYNGTNVVAKGQVPATNSQAVLNIEIPAVNSNLPLVLSVYNQNNFAWTQVSVYEDAVKTEAFTESGRLVAGISSKITVRCSDGNGAPAPASLNVTDNSGKTIAAVEVPASGLAHFTLTPELGKQYQLKLKESNATFNLPEIQKEGYVIRLNEVGTNYINLSLDGNFTQSGQTCLMLQTRGAIAWAAVLNLSENRHIIIPTFDVPSGVALLGLFDSTGHVLAQRPVYILNNNTLDFSPVSIDQSNGQQFLAIKITQPNGTASASNASVSITEAGNLSVDNFNNNYLLSTELGADRCLVNNYGEKADLDADDYLLSLHQQNFCWYKILNFDDKKAEAYKNLDGVSGYAYDVENKPVSGALVNMITPVSHQMLQVSTDSKGRFFIPEVDYQCCANINIAATSSDGATKLKVKLLDFYANDIQQRYFPLGTTLKAKDIVKNEPGTQLTARDKRLRNYASYTSVLELLKSIKYYTLTSDHKIVFPESRNSLLAQDGALIVIDGVKLGTDAEVLNTVNVNDIENITVSTDPNDISLYTGLNAVGVIVITTKNGRIPDDNEPEPVAVSPKPKCNKTYPQQTKTEDFTKYWNPDLWPDKNGRYTLDVKDLKPGNYAISILTSDANGRPVYKQFMYQVK
jgi:hypothetical protein